MSSKQALVTGAGGRLGQAMAVHLAKAGFDVAVHYATSRNGAEDTARLIEAAGQRAALVQADLVDDAETGALFSDAVAALGGPITCLINNASVFEYDTLASATLQSWDRHINSNLKAAVFLSQAMAAQDLKAIRDSQNEPQAVGLIVNMIDQRVRKLTPEFMTYTLAKSALWTFTQTAAQALAPEIRVNAIGPGPTLQGERQSTQHFERQRKSTILQRGANVEDITGALSYFLGAPAITGQLLCVDGGQHLGWQTPDILGVE